MSDSRFQKFTTTAPRIAEGTDFPSSRPPSGGSGCGCMIVVGIIAIAGVLLTGLIFA